MEKNPYEITYEEFVAFMNNLKKKVTQNKKPVKDHKTFTSKDEYLKYYGAISIDDYLKKSHSKY